MYSVIVHMVGFDFGSLITPSNCMVRERIAVQTPESLFTSIFLVVLLAISIIVRLGTYFHNNVEYAIITDWRPR